jgi:hypothetical protein
LSLYTFTWYKRSHVCIHREKAEGRKYKEGNCEKENGGKEKRNGSVRRRKMRKRNKRTWKKSGKKGRKRNRRGEEGRGKELEDRRQMEVGSKGGGLERVEGNDI